MFAIQLARGDGRQARVARGLFRVLQDGRRDVGGQDPSGGADAPCSRQALSTRAGGHIEDTIAGRNTCGVEHPLGCRTEPVFDQQAPPMPRLRGILPLRVRGDLVLPRVERRAGHGVPPPNLSLAGGNLSQRALASGAEPVLDRAALVAYRRRLADLDVELATAQENADLATHQRTNDEREQLLAELRRATRPDGGSRRFANTATERARKAVTARIRDAIRRISDAHPELGTHLDRTIRTGTTCRYEPDRTAK